MICLSSQLTLVVVSFLVKFLRAAMS